jgi:hypothetical protein
MSKKESTPVRRVKKQQLPPEDVKVLEKDLPDDTKYLTPSEIRDIEILLLTKDLQAAKYNIARLNAEIQQYKIQIMTTEKENMIKQISTLKGDTEKAIDNYKVYISDIAKAYELPQNGSWGFDQITGEVSVR